MTIETLVRTPVLQTDAHGDGNGGGLDNQQIFVPEHPEKYTPDEIKNMLYGAQLLPHTFPNNPAHQQELAGFSGFAYAGPVFMQGNRDTCVPWAITHATLAVGAKPNIEITTALLNATFPAAGEQEGLRFGEAVEIANRNQNEVSFDLDLPLQEQLNWLRALRQPVDGTKFVTAQSELQHIIRSRIRDKRAVVLTLSDKPVQTSPQDNHAICIPAYRINKKGGMEVQVLDSLTGPRFETAESLTPQVLNAHYPIMTIGRKNQTIYAHL